MMDNEQALQELEELLDEFFVARGYDVPGADWEAYPELAEEGDDYGQ